MTRQEQLEKAIEAIYQAWHRGHPERGPELHRTITQAMRLVECVCEVPGYMPGVDCRADHERLESDVRWLLNRSVRLLAVEKEVERLAAEGREGF